MSPSKVAVWVLGSVAVLGAWAESADAQECSDTSPCPRGFTCEVTAESTCAGAAPAPTMPACIAGDAGTCGAPMPVPDRPVPECTPQQYRSCVAGPCMADGDCASGMVCHEQRSGGCAVAPVAPCPPGAACPARVLPPTCTETVERLCVPRYLLPCSQASDCGAGFTCESQQQCACGGAGGAGAPVPEPGRAPEPAVDAGTDHAADPAFVPPPADGGAPERPAQPVPPPSCTCTPTAEKYCKQAEIACTTDGQCPSMWSCKVIASGGSGPTCAAPAGAGDAGTCGPAPEPVEIRRCVPPYDGINVGVSRGDGVATPTTGTPGAAEQPSPNAPIAPSAQQDAGTAEGASAGETPVHTKACSVIHAGAGSSHGLPLGASIASLAAMWFAMRRRR